MKRGVIIKMAAALALLSTAAGCRSHKSASKASADSSYVSTRKVEMAVADSMHGSLSLTADTLTVTVTDTMVIYRAVGADVRMNSSRRRSAKSAETDSVAAKTAKKEERQSAATAPAAPHRGVLWLIAVIALIALLAGVLKVIKDRL